MVIIYIIFLNKKAQFLNLKELYQLNFQQELANSQIEIKKQTLVYIGQELHDDIGQKLSVVKIMLNEALLKSSCKSGKEELQEMSNLIRDCIFDIRNLSSGLLSEDSTHFGLVENIKFEVNRLNKLKLIAVTFNCNHEDIDIDAKHSQILFRIIQEAINNVLKHSKAKNLDIFILVEENILYIDFKDDGKGMDVASARNFGGSGLKNIEFRANLINAETEITSEENVGTHLKIIYKLAV